MTEIVRRATNQTIIKGAKQVVAGANKSLESTLKIVTNAIKIKRKK